MKSPYRTHRRRPFNVNTDPTEPRPMHDNINPPPVNPPSAAPSADREEIVDAQANRFLDLLENMAETMKSIDRALWVQTHMFAEAFLDEDKDEDDDEEDDGITTAGPNDNSEFDTSLVKPAKMVVMSDSHTATGSTDFDDDEDEDEHSQSDTGLDPSDFDPGTDFDDNDDDTESDDPSKSLDSRPH